MGHDIHLSTPFICVLGCFFYVTHLISNPGQVIMSAVGMSFGDTVKDEAGSLGAPSLFFSCLLTSHFPLMGFDQKKKKNLKAIRDQEHRHRSPPPTPTPYTCLLPVPALSPDNTICQGGGRKDPDLI